MDWDATEVFPGVFVGAQDAADDERAVREAKIVRIICIREPRLKPDNSRWLNLLTAGTGLSRTLCQQILTYSGMVTRRKKLISHKGIKYLRCWATDDGSADIYRYFGLATRYAKNVTENVLVHCAAGCSRSPTVAVAIAIARHHPVVTMPTVEQFIQLAKLKRPDIRIKPSFVRQLEIWRHQIIKNRLYSE
jgi:hypothetical protein